MTKWANGMPSCFPGQCFRLVYTEGSVLWAQRAPQAKVKHSILPRSSLCPARGRTCLHEDLWTPRLLEMQRKLKSIRPPLGCLDVLGLMREAALAPRWLCWSCSGRPSCVEHWAQGQISSVGKQTQDLLMDYLTSALYICAAPFVVHTMWSTQRYKLRICWNTKQAENEPYIQWVGEKTGGCILSVFRAWARPGVLWLLCHRSPLTAMDQKGKA